MAFISLNIEQLTAFEILHSFCFNNLIKALDVSLNLNVGSSVKYAVENSSLMYSAAQCSAVQCSVVQCSAMQCSALQFSAAQFRSVQCSAVR